jgi:hypothetical protein
LQNASITPVIPTETHIDTSIPPETGTGTGSETTPNENTPLDNSNDMPIIDPIVSDSEPTTDTTTTTTPDTETTPEISAIETTPPPAEITAPTETPQ